MADQPMPDISTPLGAGLEAIHELFISYMAAGFTERQAIALIAEISVRAQQ